METAAGLASYLIDRLRGSRASHVLLAVLLVLASFAITVVVAGIFLPVPETIVAAPFRW